MTPGRIVLTTAAFMALMNSAPAQPLTAWRHAIISPKADAGFFYMAAKRGFFEREGLKVEMLEVKDEAIGMKALLSGEVASEEGTAGAIAAAARGAAVTILGCPWHGVPYVLLARPGISGMSDIKGKSIAASAPGSPPDTMARGSLALAGISPEAVKFSAVGGDRDRYAALLGGVVDAAVVSNEYQPLPSTRNFHILMEGTQVMPKWVRFCIQTIASTIVKRREDLIRFMVAEIKAWRYALADRDETIKVAIEATGAKAADPRPAFIYDDAVKTGIIQPDFPLPLDKLAWMTERMVALGQIPKAVDVNNIVNGDIRAEALKRIGN